MKICNVCAEEFSNFDELLVHGEEKHLDHFFQGTKSQGKFAEKNFWSPLSNQWFAARKWLARDITNHKLTNEQFYIAYGQQYMPSDWKRNNESEKYGNAAGVPECLQCNKITKFQKMKWQYPIFCGFSCSTNWHAKNTDRVSVAMATLKSRQLADPMFNLHPNQAQYWVNKGFSNDEAKEKVSDRQKTFSLEKCIEKLGEEAGKQRFIDRQEKWIQSTSQNQMFKGYSNISFDLFSKLQKVSGNLKFGKEEATIRLQNRICKIDCMDDTQNKAIEFYGDYWHANPKTKFGTQALKGKTPQQIWDKDKKRQEDIIAAGYKLLVIWENDYRVNPDEVLGKCINFLLLDK